MMRSYNYLKYLKGEVEGKVLANFGHWWGGIPTEFIAMKISEFNINNSHIYIQI